MQVVLQSDRIQAQDQQQKRSLESRLRELEKPTAVTSALLTQHKTSNETSVDTKERLKLIKLSRSCSKKNLERFFQVDPSTSSLVYFEKPGDPKAKKTLTLKESKVTIEKRASHQQEGETPETAWAKKSLKFRVRIALKARDFKPVYHYTDSFAKAVGIKHLIVSMIQGVDPAAAKSINEAVKVFQQMAVNCLILRMDQAVKSRLRQVEEKKEPIQVEVSVAKVIVEEKKVSYAAPIVEIPQLRSTLRTGVLRPADQEIFKPFSKVQRLLSKTLVPLFRTRRQTRPEVWEKLVACRPATFNVGEGSNYKVDKDIVKQWQTLFGGNQPYPSRDIKASKITIAKQGLIISDSVGMQQTVDIREVCFATVKQDTVTLFGRKITHNVDLSNENLVPQEVGLERSKQSYLNEARIATIDLKSMHIPPELLNTQVNPADQTLYRVRVHCGEHFYCTSTPVTASQLHSLRETLSFDLQGHKFLQFTILSLKGRGHMLDSLVNERLVCTTSVPIDLASSEPLRITFSQGIFSSEASQEGLALTLKLTISKGITQTELQGPQLLIGGYAQCQNEVVRVLQVNRSSVEVEDMQGKQRKVPVSSLRLIERYGISLYDRAVPANLAKARFEWTLTVKLPSSEEFVRQVKQAIRMAQVMVKGNRRPPISGKLLVHVVSASHLYSENSKLCESFAKVTSRDIEYLTGNVPESNNPIWSKTPFDMGSFSEETDCTPLKIEVFNLKKRSMFSSELEPELIGEVSITIEDLLQCPGQELHLHLEKSRNPDADSVIQVHTLLLKEGSLYQSARHYGVCKVLGMTHELDFMGYQVPIGHWQGQSHRLHLFRHLWNYSSFMWRSKYVRDKQRRLWQMFGAYLSEESETGLIDDDLRSIKSKLTNTTKMLSVKYKNVKGRTRKPEENNKLSVVFAGQWERQDQLKFSELWYLFKHGVPPELRTDLWHDLLRRKVYEQQARAYLVSKREDSGQNVYEVLSRLADAQDSDFHRQLESDVGNYKFSSSFEAGSSDRIRASILQILKSYALWSTKKTGHIQVYSRGLIAVLQRLLTFMSEESAFWVLVGLGKSLKKVLSLDISPESTPYEQCNPFTSRKLCYRNEMIIVAALVKIHHPEVFAHLKSLGMPIEWYFYEQFSQFFSGLFTSEVLLRLWDMVMLNLSTSEYQHRKRALWYLLAVPLYLISKHSEEILTIQNPVKIKQILESTPVYDPLVFINELLGLIQKLFVERTDNPLYRLNRMLTLDNPNKLEALRKEIENEYAYYHEEGRQAAKRVSKQVFEGDVEVALARDARALTDTKVRNLNDSEVTIDINIQSTRGIATGFYQLTVKCGTVAQQDNLKVGPQTADGISSASSKISVSVSRGILSKTLDVQVSLQGSLTGQGTLLVKDILGRESQVCLKLSDERTMSQASLDILINSQTFQQDPKLQGLPVMERDLLNREADDGLAITLLQGVQLKLTPHEREVQLEDAIVTAVARQGSPNDAEYACALQKVAERVLKQGSDRPLSSKGTLTDLTRVVQSLREIASTVPGLIQDLQKNPTSAVLQLLTFSNTNPAQELLASIAILFPLMSVSDAQRIASLLYSKVCHYPIPLNEVQLMVNHAFTHAYSFIINVTLTEAEPPRDSFIGKMFASSGSQTADVTTQFRTRLGALIRHTGLTHCIDLGQQPFSDLRFWLGSSSKPSSTLAVTQQDIKGNHVIYRFAFNSESVLSPGQSSILYLEQYAGAPVTQEQIVEVFSRLPLIADVLSQNLFTRHQLKPQNDVMVEAPGSYSVSVATVSKVFNVSFSDQVDKRDDYTIVGKDAVLKIHGNLAKFYKRAILAGGINEYSIQLSPLSLQNTFLTVKARVQKAIDVICENECIGPAPDVLEWDVKGIHSSMDRIGEVTDARTFELVQTPKVPREWQIPSFGLYIHPSGTQEWREGNVLKRTGHSNFQVSFDATSSYIFSRDQLRLSESDRLKHETEAHEAETKELIEKLLGEDLDAWTASTPIEAQQDTGLAIGNQQLDAMDDFSER